MALRRSFAATMTPRIRFLAAAFGWLAGTLMFGAEALTRQEWAVGGMKREGLVHRPTTVGERGAPLVFVFHGHGGSMQTAARSQPVHELWPEALVVYLQGVPTPGRLTDPEGKRNGWQHNAGD